MLLYHHCRSLESVVFGKVKANPKYSDPDFKDAYLWLKGEVGFYPLFLSVGTTYDDILMTGYPNQWRKIISTKIVGRRGNGTYIQKNVLRKKGEFPNDVLFSFEELRCPFSMPRNTIRSIQLRCPMEWAFMDYGYWHLALGSYRDKITDYEKRLIFKPSWQKSKWLGKAKKISQSVQLVTQSLYLPDAQRIWVRNKKTKKVLEGMGFDNVEVKRPALLHLRVLGKGL